VKCGSVYSVFPFGEAIAAVAVFILILLIANLGEVKHLAPVVVGRGQAGAYELLVQARPGSGEGGEVAVGGHLDDRVPQTIQEEGAVVSVAGTKLVAGHHHHAMHRSNRYSRRSWTLGLLPITKKS
jgi:hypothetical protein